MNLMKLVVLQTFILLAVYWLIVSSFGLKPKFAELNYTANLVRLESLQRATDFSVAIVGSSLSARLDSAKFGGDLPSVNLSLDGSSALFGSELLLASGIQANVLLLELNTIFRDTISNDKALSEGLASSSIRLAKYIPFFRASMRPSSILYSKLKERRDPGTVSFSDLSQYEHLRPIRIRSEEGEESIEVGHKRLEKIVRAFQSSGTRVVLLVMPADARDKQKAVSVGHKLSEKYGIEFLDLYNELPRSELIFSDGHHLNSSSASAVSELISKALELSPN